MSPSKSFAVSPFLHLSTLAAALSRLLATVRSFEAHKSLNAGPPFAKLVHRKYADVKLVLNRKTYKTEKTYAIGEERVVSNNC